MRCAPLPEPFVFFCDRALGRRVVPQLIKDANEEVRIHDEMFDQDTPDEVWLEVIGKNGWVALTKDSAIRRNQLLIRSVMTYNVAIFMVGRADATGDEVGKCVVDALPSIKKALRRFRRPLVASVSLTGQVTVLHDRNGLLEKGQVIKVKARK